MNAPWTSTAVFSTFILFCQNNENQLQYCEVHFSNPRGKCDFLKMSNNIRLAKLIIKNTAKKKE